MICQAITTLRKTDTDGRIPAYTLDQYVRNELSKQLIEAVKPALSVRRTDTDAPTVDFSAELILLTPAQWQCLKETLIPILATLPTDQQVTLRQLFDSVAYPTPTAPR